MRQDLLVLKNGKIVEQGNHKSLLSISGLYSKMYEMQSIKI